MRPGTATGFKTDSENIELVNRFDLLILIIRRKAVKKYAVDKHLAE